MDVKDLLRRKKIKKDKRSLSLQEGTDLVAVEYEITTEKLSNKGFDKLPFKVRKQIEQLYELLRSKPKQVIPSLLELIEKYPNVAVLYNYLIAAYRLSGQNEKADSMTVESYKRHPDYLFAKISYAFYCLRKGDPYKVPEIFDHKLELRQLYPHRKKFHITEFINFMGLMALYHNAIGEREIAIRYYDMIKQVDPNDNMVQVLKKVLYPSFLARVLRKIIKKPLGNIT